MLTTNSTASLLKASLLLLVIGYAPVQALQPEAPGSAPVTDSTENLQFSADGPGSIESSGNTRITTLRDNVRFVQGPIAILGHTARLEQDIETGELIRVTVEGQPARFSRAAPADADNAESSADTETITGHSESIVYYNQPAADALSGRELLSVVEFIGDASFSRGRTAFQCSQIKHIIETGATDSPGPCSGVVAPTPGPETVPQTTPETAPATENSTN